MKLTPLLTTALTLTCGALIAQDTGLQQDATRQDQSQPQQEQSGQLNPGAASQEDNNSIISEPAGAERPQGRPFGTNPPPGRAFSETNPPPGRPFEEGGRPPGRAFEDQPAIEEPSGAQPSDDQQIDTNQQQDVNEPAGAETDTSIDATQQQDSAVEQSEDPLQNDQSGVQNEPAGAQRGGSEQIASALGTLRGGATVGGTGQNVQLRQALKTSIQGRNVPDEFVDRLSQDLSMAFTKGEIQESVRTQLAQSLHTVLTAQPTAQTEVEQALSRVQTILIDNGASRPAARAVACDLHLIATEMHPNMEISVPVPAR